ncbi:hypothetical protein [Teredinibacter sp. KSP-S5-2]|uniref:HEAT repeat domain-containing protein n=1 Tax=Teredinibacter sp. KSP-S5-2 TaxID=3034506 RepID=UPI002934C94C|nr:hypothetical protein [Teredinibacter sp. KSP-S5-2]WNO10848.1 hypothetical protein P5V12_06630 [Teredinibacter sp. KSP-S5-2]
MEYKNSEEKRIAKDTFVSKGREKQLISQSKDSNGYIREAAVKALSCFPSEDTVEALIIRTNDWVPIIRSRAKEILTDMLSESSAIYYAKKLNRFYHLRQCGRSEHSSFVREIEKQLCLFPDALKEALRKSSAESALYSAKLLARAEHFSKKALFDLCLASRYVRVRQFGLSSLEQVSEVDGHILGKVSILDKSARVRSEAFRQLVRLAENESLQVAKELMFDSHTGVRSAAVFQLKKSGFDCVDVYLKQLNTEMPRKQKIAIWGLMELFSKASLSEVLPKLDSEYPSVRLQALRACYVFAEETDLVSILKRMMMDDSPKIVKECARMLEKSNLVISLEEFETILLGQKSVGVYPALLRTTHKMNKWKQLLFLSKLSKAANKELACSIEKVLMLWVEKMANFFVDPSTVQIEQINSLGKCEKKLWSTSVKHVIKYRFSLI